MEWNISDRTSGEFGYEGCETAGIRLEFPWLGKSPGWAARLFIAIVVCATASFGVCAENDDGGVNATAVASVAVSTAVDSSMPIQPWIHHKMDPDVRATLEAGFDLAVERVREIEECADLFTGLGVIGIDMLNTGLYLPVHSYRHEIAVCGRDPATNSTGAKVLAYTKVGGSATWICRHFSRVSTENAAIAVIHEALHHAGLNERPHDRMAMSSVEITEMVTSACGFK